jgi:hypothetical protein
VDIIQTSSPYLAERVQFFQPIERFTGLLLSSLHRFKQQLNHRCKFCNNLSPVWHLRSGGDRGYDARTKLTDIVSHTSECKYCYTIASALHNLFPETQNQSTEWIILFITAWLGRPVQMFFGESGRLSSDIRVDLFAIDSMFQHFLN